MMLLRLTKGYWAQVDSADWARLSEFNWQASVQRNTVYGRRAIWNKERKNNDFVYLHVDISGTRVDHIDGNGLNCQRSNLRPASKAENSYAFRTKSPRCSSIFRGVSWHSHAGAWRAYIEKAGVLKHLGIFEIEEDAAKAYDRAARELFGEFASPNFPTQ